MKAFDFTHDDGRECMLLISRHSYPMWTYDDGHKGGVCGRPHSRIPVTCVRCKQETFEPHNHECPS